MQGITNFISFIGDNYMMILVNIAMVLGIYKKTKDFFSQKKEDQLKQMYEQSDKVVSLIYSGILDMVTTAEKKYGSKTGRIKKSAVYNMIVEKYPDIVTYLKENVLTEDYIDSCIEQGVILMNDMIKSNTALQKTLGVDKLEIEDTKDDTK